MHTSSEVSRSALALNHERLVKNNRAEYRRFCRLYNKLRKLNPRTPCEADVEHARDRSCCERESWEETVKRLSLRIESRP
jgi:hypothetical protein